MIMDVQAVTSVMILTANFVDVRSVIQHIASIKRGKGVLCPYADAFIAALKPRMSVCLSEKVWKSLKIRKQFSLTMWKCNTLCQHVMVKLSRS